MMWYIIVYLVMGVLVHIIGVKSGFFDRDSELGDFVACIFLWPFALYFMSVWFAAKNKSYFLRYYDWLRKDNENKQ